MLQTIRRWARLGLPAILLACLCLLLSSSAAAQVDANARGWCEAGAQPVITSGLTSTTEVQASFPQCTVTVLVHGGGTATIYADSNLTPLSNPFTAQTDGQWLFYAGSGRYDVVLTCAGNCTPPIPSPFPITYSDIQLNISGGLEPVSITVSPLCPTQGFNGCYFAYLDVQTAYDVSVTMGSPVITSAGQATFACPGSIYPCTSGGDIGKYVFVTSGCILGTCGYQSFTTSTTILPAQTAIATIVSIQSPHVATASANATATYAYGIVAWGHKDTANIKAAWNAVLAQPNCSTLTLPAAWYFFDDPIYTSPLNGGTNQCVDIIHGVSQATLVGPKIQGQGMSSTVGVPTPDFNFADCLLYQNNTCIGGGTTELSITQMGFAGLGQSFTGATLPGSLILFQGSNSQFFHNVSATGWVTNPTLSGGSSIIGTLFAPYSFGSDNYFSGWGQIVCSGEGYVQLSNSTCGGGTVASLEVQAGTNSSFQSSNNQFWPATGSESVIIANGTLDSTNDQVQISAASTGPTVQVNSGGVVHSKNFTVGQPSAQLTTVPFNVAPGGALFLGDLHVGGSTYACVNNFGIYHDTGGNECGGGIIGGTGEFYGASLTALTDGSTITWDLQNDLRANAHVTIAGNRTLSLLNLASGGHYTLTVTESGSAYTLALGSSCHWLVSGNGVSIATLSGANATDQLDFWYDGQNCALTVIPNISAAAGTVTDNFMRANAYPLSGSWTQQNGGDAFQLLSDTVAFAPSLLNAYTSGMYTGSGLGQDQYAQAVVTQSTGVAFISPAVRMEIGSESGYVCISFNGAWPGSSQTWAVRRYSGNGTFINGPYGSAATVSSGDTLKISAVGLTITCTDSTTSTTLATITDSTAVYGGVPLSYGFPGLWGFMTSVSNANFTSFQASDVITANSLPIPYVAPLEPPSVITTGGNGFGSNQTTSVAACETSFGATTLSGASTNTGLSCLPGNAIIDMVAYRITTTITTATSFTIGDSGSATRYCGTQSTLTAGTTGLCSAAGYYFNTSAAPVKITPSTTPGAGAIRLVVYYHTWTAPTG